jgi:hypothetical protein
MNRTVYMTGEDLRPRVCASMNAASRKPLNNSPAEGTGCLPLAHDSSKSPSKRTVDEIWRGNFEEICVLDNTEIVTRRRCLQ